MKRIIDTSTGKTVWRGEEYLVDGKSGEVEGTLLLAEEEFEPIPEHDQSTHHAVASPKIVDGKFITSYEIRKNAIVIPPSIDGWRAVSVLAEIGMLNRVMHEIRQLEEPDRAIAIAQFNSYAPWYRDGPILTKVASKIEEFTPEAIDDLFIKASRLPAG